MTAPPRVSLKELTAQSFRIGCLGFGGPAGQIALMHRIFVDEKEWLDEERYLHGLNFCMLLPGPEAQQLAVYAGWLLNGVRGGVIAGTLFVLPGAIVVFALSWLYVAHADAPIVAAAFYGVKIAVLAIVAEAVVRIGKRALKGAGAAMIALGSFTALFVFGAPFPLVILAAAAVGGVMAARTPAPAPAVSPSPQGTKGAASTAALWTVLWLAPLALVFQILGGDHVLTRVGILFSKLAVVTFGGAYAVLAYLQQQAVEVEGWLTAGQMIDGLGLAETTPGPLVLVNQFVGFLAGWNAGSGIWLAAATAAMASWSTFAPSFVWIFAGAPHAERLRENRIARNALAAVTAAVLGVVANLALWFALHVVFARTHAIATPWGRNLALPELTSIDVLAAVLALAAGVALIRFKVHMLIVIALCAAIGIARGLLEPSDFPAVIGPVQQRLTLPPPAEDVARLTVLPDLRGVTADRFPPLDLARILIGHPPAHVIAAIPLEPAARIVGVDPSLAFPFGEGLARIDAEEIQRTIAFAVRELCACEPARRKFAAAVGHVLAAEDAEMKHLFGCQVGREFRIETSPRRGDKLVAVIPLHPVVDGDDTLFHADALAGDVSITKSARERIAKAQSTQPAPVLRGAIRRRPCRRCRTSDPSAQRASGVG